ncbi:MAG: DUF3102 domain-containing protein [Spirulina sp.]
MTQTVSLESYDFYKQFDLETRERLKQKADRIKLRHRTMVEAILTIGKDLLEEKERLPHGKFGEWLEIEFPEYSHQTLNNWMNVFREFGDENPNHLENINANALYLLSAKSTPPSVRGVALKMAETGAVKLSDVKQLKDNSEKEENFSARALYAASAKSTPPEVREQALQMSRSGEKITPTTVDALKVAAKNEGWEVGEYRYAYTGNPVIATIGKKDTLSAGQEIQYREGTDCLFAWKKCDPKTIFKIAKNDVKEHPVLPCYTRVSTLFGEGFVTNKKSEAPAKVFVYVGDIDDRGSALEEYELDISALQILPKPKEKFPSVEEELDSQAQDLGLPTGEQALPDVPRNEGDPTTLQPQGMGAVGAMPEQIVEGAWVVEIAHYKNIMRQLENQQAVFPNCGRVVKIEGRNAHCKWYSGLSDEKFKLNDLSPLPPHIQDQMTTRMDKSLHPDKHEALGSEIKLENAIYNYLGGQDQEPFVINPDPKFFKTKVLNGYRILLTTNTPSFLIPMVLEAAEAEKINRAIVMLSLRFVSRQANMGAFQKTLGAARRVLWPMFFNDLLLLDFSRFDPNESPYGGFIDCFRNLGAWGSFNLDAEW